MLLARQRWQLWVGNKKTGHIDEVVCESYLNKLLGYGVKNSLYKLNLRVLLM